MITYKLSALLNFKVHSIDGQSDVESTVKHLNYVAV